MTTNSSLPHTDEYTADELVKLVTAFPHLAAMVKAMEKDGYIPTLAPLPGKSQRVIRRNELTAALADRLEAKGWTVWRGSLLGACLACYHRGLAGRPGSEPLESDARVVKHD